MLNFIFKTYQWGARMIRGLLGHHRISSTGFQETLDHVSHNRFFPPLRYEVKGWLTLVLDKVLRAVSSLAEPRTFGSISAAFKQECLKRVMGMGSPPEPLKAGTKSSFFKARLVSCCRFYVWAHLYSSHDFSTTKVWDESWRRKQKDLKKGKMTVVVTQNLLVSIP